MTLLLVGGVAVSVSALGLALGALFLAVTTKIELEAQKKSTHKIQFMPLGPTSELQDFKFDDEAIPPLTPEQIKAINQDPFGEL
jgi:hypothetical protein